MASIKKDDFGKFFSDTWETVKDRTGLRDLSEGFLEGNPDRLVDGLNKLRGGPRPYLPGDPVRDKFIESNSSYSGSDCVVIAQINQNLVILGNVSTFSYSIFREKSPVRVLGRSYAKGYTAGPRTIAGSIVFVVFDRNPLYQILNSLNFQDGPPNDRYSTPVADQIPPIDLILWFSNEYGHKSILRLYGVEFMQEGQTHSINDLYSENVMQYVARDLDVLINYDDVENFRNLLYERQVSGQFTDNYLASMLAYQKKIAAQLQQVDAEILNIQQERGKQNMVTFGILGTVNSTLRKKYDRQLIIKESLVAELEKINKIILKYQNTTYSWKPESKLDATANHDRLQQENVTIPGTVPDSSSFPHRPSPFSEIG
jgi:hypothetical protein